MKECYNCNEGAKIFVKVWMYTVYPNDMSRKDGYEKQILCLPCLKETTDYMESLDLPKWRSKQERREYEAVSE